jgi:phage-related minor tail protein
MKKTKAATAVSMLGAAVLILFLASAFADQQTTSENKATTKDVKQETLEAIEAIKKYSIEKKDKAVREVKVVLEDLDARIDRMQIRLEKKWDEMDQASREKAANTIQALRKKRNEPSEWYGGLKHSSADAWEEVKNGFVKGYEALANAFDKAENELSSDDSGKSGG